jgi:hypothetical protein
VGSALQVPLDLQEVLEYKVPLADLAQPVQVEHKDQLAQVEWPELQEPQEQVVFKVLLDLQEQLDHKVLLLLLLDRCLM